MTAGITQEEFIEALAAHGVSVTPRRLTDWRAKGLLPPLRSHGRGRGQGRVYCVEDAESVLEQTVTIDWLLAHRSRTEPALLTLWSGGFSVETSRAKRAWLTVLRRSAISPHDAEGAAIDWAEKIAPKLAVQHSIDRNALAEVLALILGLIFNPAFVFDPTSDSELIARVLQWLLREDILTATVDLLDETKQRDAINLAKATFSATAVLNIVARSTRKELSQAQAAWKSITEIARRLAGKRPQVHNRQIGPADGTRLAIVFGLPAIFAALVMIKFDDHRCFERSIELARLLLRQPEFEIALDRLKSPGNNPPRQLKEISELTNALGSIWSEFNFHEFRSKIQEFQ